MEECTMKEVLASVGNPINDLKCRLHETSVDEKGITIKTLIISVQPQRMVFVTFFIHHPNWLYDSYKKTFKTFGHEPHFEVKSVDQVKLYPTQMLDTEGITDEQYKDFVQKVNPDICNVISSYTEM